MREMIARLFGKDRIPKGHVDHSREERKFPQPAYMSHTINAALIEPYIQRAMERYRIGPKEGQVYWLLYNKLEEAKEAASKNKRSRIYISWEELHFITKELGDDDRVLIETNLKEIDRRYNYG